jgi:Transposase IS4
VTTTEHERARRTGDEGLLHGTAVLQRIVGPWAGTGRIVTADSYFSSVQAAVHLKNVLGLRLIGVVKTATRGFRMKLLQAIELSSRGDYVSFVSSASPGERSDLQPGLMAVLWLDRERQYFISSTSSCREGASYTRTSWRKTADGAGKQLFTIRQPVDAEIYYSACPQIDRHNRCLQDDL